MNTSDFIVSIHEEFRAEGGHAVELRGIVETSDCRYRFDCVAELGAIFDRERKRARELTMPSYAAQA